MPVRKIGPKRGVNRRCVVVRPNPDDSGVFGESLLERDFIRMCNVDPNVMKIEYQPICIEFNYASKRRRYFPDFLLTMVDGSKELVEVKLHVRVDDEENKIKFKVGEVYCQEQGWKFKVVTEEDLHRGHLATNVNKLLDVQRFLISVGIQYEVYEAFTQKVPCSIYECWKQHDEMDIGLFSSAVYKLLISQHLLSDLVNEPLSLNSIIKINEKRLWDEDFR